MKLQIGEYRVDVFVRKPGAKKPGQFVERLAQCRYPTHPEWLGVGFTQFKLSDEFLAVARAHAPLGRLPAIDWCDPDGWVPPFCPRCTHRDLARAELSRAPDGRESNVALDRQYVDDERLAMAEA